MEEVYLISTESEEVQVEKDELKKDVIHTLDDNVINEPIGASVDEHPIVEKPYDDVYDEEEGGEVEGEEEEEDDDDDENNQYPEESNLSGQIDDLKKSISGIREMMENVQFNVARLVQNQASAADVAVLQRENEAFRSDSNMKLMRRYGIDAMIKTYQAICDRIFQLTHPSSDSEASITEINTLKWVLKRIERQFKPLGIKLRTTQPGAAIDESVMEIYGSNGEDVEDSDTIVETDDPTLKDTVKESVCPAFVWTIPSLIGDVKEWCMAVEKVCIFK